MGVAGDGLVVSSSERPPQQHGHVIDSPIEHLETTSSAAMTTARAAAGQSL
jgi:hypothetical protein